MANDAYDNAQADKVILRKIEAEWAAERARKQAAGPQLGLTDGICSRCGGTGVGTSRFEWDEFNLAGYWEHEPCESCRSTGLNPKIDDALEVGVYAERARDEAWELINEVEAKLKELRQKLDAVPNPPVKGDLRAWVETADTAVAEAIEELEELERKISPPDPEGT